ncbi:hypothetical protein [Neoaquamicrobium sediminum]|uniref:hypothetical protein n=1 Tax=Neoaquamicrobium sediminum TaxID=1849104 RepID=UPI00360725BB
MAKVGDIYLECFVADGTGKVTFEQHIVRTIRGGYVHAIQKSICTWGKLSKKHGDYGWLPSIDPMWRTKWRVGEKPPPKLAKTKAQAIRAEIANIKRWAEDDDYDDGITVASIVKKLEGMLKRERP